MSRRKICVVTGTRAEYGLFYPILKEIKSRKDLKLQLVVTTAHLSEEFGLTYKQIEKDGFKIDAKIENLSASDENSSIAKSTGLGTMLISDVLTKLKPDLVLILGDRFEALAAATSALLMNLPIGHIHGGEITKGAVDEQIRHSITKMSHLHFCSTEQYRKRIIQMGEDPIKVFNTGAPGLDNIKNLDIIPKKELENQIDWSLSESFALFTYHPSSLEDENLIEDLKHIFEILSDLNLRILFTYANADSGGRLINKKIEDFSRIDAKKYKVIKNLGQSRYLSSIHYSDIMIGNSSSGIIEAASFFKPVVNIGNRQFGRLSGKNVIDCNIEDLKESIQKALSEKFKKECKNIENIYGDGFSAKRIVDKISYEPLSISKHFFDFKDSR